MLFTHLFLDNKQYHDNVRNCDDSVILEHNIGLDVERTLC